MEESISGFKVTGSWAEIVEHGERITYALRDLGVDRRGDEEDSFASAFQEWDDWRPKMDERMRDEVAEKTAEQASIAEGAGEKAGNSPNEDLKTAGEKISESYESLPDDSETAASKWSESIDYAARAADSVGRKALRAVEDTVYKRVMTNISPHYFDNELISAYLQRKRGANDPTYSFEVNVNDEDLKSQVAEQLEKYDRDMSRWHVETPTRTERIEAAEGVDLSDSEANTPK